MLFFGQNFCVNTASTQQENFKMIKFIRSKALRRPCSPFGDWMNNFSFFELANEENVSVTEGIWLRQDEMPEIRRETRQMRWEIIFCMSHVECKNIHEIQSDSSLAHLELLMNGKRLLRVELAHSLAHYKGSASG
jgi:hypothetical protein